MKYSYIGEKILRVIINNCRKIKGQKRKTVTFTPVHFILSFNKKEAIGHLTSHIFSQRRKYTKWKWHFCDIMRAHLTLNLLAPTTVGARINPYATNVIFIHLVVCLTTGPKPLPKRALHIVRSRASSFKWEYPLLSLRSSNSFLRLLPCLPVTSIPPCIFPSVTCCRRQFRRKMWPIQFAFRLRI